MAVDLHDSTALVTGATGGIGQAIARALHARGATVIVTGRNAPTCSRSLRDELGTASRRWSPTSRDRRRWRRLRRADGRRRAGRERRAAGVRAARQLHRRGDRPRARRQPARADAARAGAACPACVERGSGPHRADLVAGRQGRERRARPSTARPSSGCAASASRSTRSCAGPGSGSTTVFPGFIRDAGMFADSGAKLPRGVGTRTPEDVADAVLRGIEKNRAEIDVAPLSARARRARLFAHARRATARAGCNRRSASDPLADADRRRASATSAEVTLGCRLARCRRHGRLPRERRDQLGEPLRLVLGHERAASPRSARAARSGSRARAARAHSVGKRSFSGPGDQHRLVELVEAAAPPPACGVARRPSAAWRCRASRRAFVSTRSQPRPS